MNVEDLEIAAYLRELLDHQSDCELAPCPTCAALRRIVELVREQLFDTVVYAGEGRPAGAPPASGEATKLFSPRRRIHSGR